MPVLVPYTKFPNIWADHNSFPIPGLFAREQHKVHLIKTCWHSACYLDDESATMRSRFWSRSGHIDAYILWVDRFLKFYFDK